MGTLRFLLRTDRLSSVIEICAELCCVVLSRFIVCVGD